MEQLENLQSQPFGRREARPYTPRAREVVSQTFTVR